jgi:hypothetical protein
VTGQHSAGPVPVTWLDEEDVAALLRTPVNTVMSWRRRRIGPVFHRVGRRCLYDAIDVDKFVKTGRVETSGTVVAPGPERPPARKPVRSDDDVRPAAGDRPERPSMGSGAVTPGVRPAWHGLPGVPVSGDVSPDLNNACEDVE